MDTTHGLFSINRDFCIVELLSYKAYTCNTVGIEYSMIEVVQTSTSLGALIKRSTSRLVSKSLLLSINT